MLVEAGGPGCCPPFRQKLGDAARQGAERTIGVIVRLSGARDRHRRTTVVTIGDEKDRNDDRLYGRLAVQASDAAKMAQVSTPTGVAA